MNLPINTLQMAKRFEQSGFSVQQSETLSETIFETLDDHTSGFATAEALERTETALRKDMELLDQKIDHRYEMLDQKIDKLEVGLRAEFKEGLQDLGQKLTIRLGSLMVGLFTIFSGIIGFIALIDL